MSHDTGVDGDNKSTNTGPGDDSRSLGRRGFLKAAGVATAGALLSTASQAVAASSHPKGIIFDGSGTSATSEYAFTASESAEKIYDSDDHDVAIESGSVAGSIGDSIVAFGYSGSLTELDMTGPASILLGPEIENELPDPAHELIITAEGEISYEFTTTGEITKLLDNGRNSAEKNNDTVVENDDGTWTATGYTGNGYGDGFTYRGEVTSFTPQTGAFELYRDGEATDTYELTGTEPPSGSELLIRSDGEIAYEFTATDEVSKLLDNGRNSAEENNDSVVQNDDDTWTVTGYTGNGYGDGFRVNGDITSFSPMEGDYTLTYGGETVTAYELTGEQPNRSSTPNIGGNEGYKNTVDISEASVVVSTRSELATELNNASSGDVVYVDGNADIDMKTSELKIPQGVTLASDRGIDGSSGGRLYTTQNPWGMLEAQSNVRVTGLELEGPRDGWESDTETEMCIDASDSDGVEIDNINGHSWGYAVVRTGDDTHVHHSNLHHNTRKGHGYGVATEGSTNPIVEYNEFSYNRHSVQGNGGGYTIRYNHVKAGAISHVFDQHRPGGTTMKIHNNTVEVVQNDIKDKKVPAVAIRGVPEDVADIHNNWFYNPDKPRGSPNGWTDEAIIQVHTDSWQNVEFSNNQYGSTEPPSDIGHPR